jgi:hypothetical protein
VQKIELVIALFQVTFTTKPRTESHFRDLERNSVARGRA